jgi:predicted metal-dependent peptidase
MESCLPTALGAIGYFCDGAGVCDVHIVQCDVSVTKDEWVEPAALAEYNVAGFGYSDMRPAMRHLADDPDVTAALMLTDGYIDVLTDEPPYHLMWVLLGERDHNFAPGYGEIVHLDVLATK